jgi:hypothetical protein
MRHSWKFVAALAASLVSASVMADVINGYGVATSARARSYYDGAAYVAAFRTSQDPSTNYTRPGDVPSVLYSGGCSSPAPIPGCSGGVSGTSGTDYNLTASNSAAFRTSVGAGTGSASSRANLATAELGVVASSDLFSPVIGNGAQGFAYMNDTLKFNVAGADASTVSHIGIDFILNGGWGLIDPNGGASVQTRLNFGDAYALFNTGTGWAVGGMHLDGGWVSASWVTDPTGSFHFTAIYALMGTSATLGFNEFLSADVGNGATAEYGSTSHFRLTLPDNVTFTSNSGVFLTPVIDPPSGVPEPGTAALLLAALGAMASLTRRGRAGTAKRHGVCA